MYTTYEEAMEALDAAISDVRADMGDDAVDEGFQDIVEAVAWDCTEQVWTELFRTQIGYVPQGFAQFKGVEPIDFLESV